MITQEMVKVGLREATEQASSYNVSITHYALEQIICHTLKAVYPMILEQAAGACEAKRSLFLDEATKSENQITRMTFEACMIAATGCAQEIRNLKEVPNSKS